MVSIDPTQLDVIQSLVRRDDKPAAQESPQAGPAGPSDEVSLKRREDREQDRHLHQQRELQMAAVTRGNLVDVHKMEAAALQRFAGYARVDNQPGTDAEPTPGLVCSRSRDGSLHQAILVDAMKGYQMHSRVIGPDGVVRSRTFCNIDYVFDKQKMGRLKSFNSVTIVTAPGQQPRGEVCTTAHPMAYACQGGPEEQTRMTTLGGDEQELPTNVVRVGMEAGEASSQARQFDETFNSEWNQARAAFRQTHAEDNLELSVSTMKAWYAHQQAAG